MIKKIYFIDNKTKKEKKKKEKRERREREKNQRFLALGIEEKGVVNTAPQTIDH